MTQTTDPLNEIARLQRELAKAKATIQAVRDYPLVPKFICDLIERCEKELT
jgi:hypothetical protein